MACPYCCDEHAKCRRDGCARCCNCGADLSDPLDVTKLRAENAALKARIAELEARPSSLVVASRMAAAQGRTLGAGGVVLALLAGQPRADQATTIEAPPPDDLLDRITPGGCRHTRRSLRPDPHGNPETTCIDCGDAIP